MLNLHRGSLDMLRAIGRLFLRGGARRESAGASVIAHVVHVDVIDDHDLGVDVRYVRDVVDRSVVEEGSIVPIPALIAYASVAEAVVDAAVESNLGTPIALVKDKRSIGPAPVTRGP